MHKACYNCIICFYISLCNQCESAVFLFIWKWLWSQNVDVMYDKEWTKNDLHGLSAIAKHCLHAHLKKTKKQAKCLHVFTHGLLVHTYTTGLMITLRADRKVSTSLTAYVTYLLDSKQKSTEARSMCSLFYLFIDVLVLNWPVYFTYSPLH